MGASRVGWWRQPHRRPATRSETARAPPPAPSEDADLVVGQGVRVWWEGDQYSAQVVTVKKLDGSVRVQCVEPPWDGWFEDIPRNLLWPYVVPGAVVARQLF